MTMTSKERFSRIYQHKEPDRVAMAESPWSTTIARWRREGMPEDADIKEYFGLDRVVGVSVDSGPQYPSTVIEETDEYSITTSAWGATVKNWKHQTSTPEHIDFKIVDRESWAKAKERMQPTPDRINWENLEKSYRDALDQGAWIVAGGWFGYDILASGVIGTEQMLIAMAEDPDWCRDMFEHTLSVNLALFDMIIDKGYSFDCLQFPDDLGYRNGLFFSPEMYRRVLKPVHKKAFDWAHDRGMVTMLHSCGNIMEAIPDLIDAGLDGLNPIETKAGMDLIGIKDKFGDDLVLQGGIDVRQMNKPDKIEDEIRTKVTHAMKNGGYIFHSDHSVPDDVSLDDYKRVIELVKKYGTYQ